MRLPVDIFSGEKSETVATRQNASHNSQSVVRTS